MQENINLDEIRKNALAKVEKSERNYKLAFYGVAIVEAIFLLLMVWVTDFKDRLHLIIFISSLAIYTIIGLGLVTLGAYQNRHTQILLKAISLLEKEKE